MSEQEEENRTKTCLCKYCESEACHKETNGNGKKSSKNKRRDIENPGEVLFQKAVKILIREKRIDDYCYSRDFDDNGIDFVLIKFINLSEKKTKIALHIQIKQVENGIKKHENRYPVIPIIVINPESPVEEVKKEIMDFFLESFKSSRYYPHILLDFDKTLKH